MQTSPLANRPAQQKTVKKRSRQVLQLKNIKTEVIMDIYEEIELMGCPYCGGAGFLDDGNGWCWTVTCMDCGSQTGEFAYNSPEERADAARKAAHVWNLGKVIRSDLGE